MTLKEQTQAAAKTIESMKKVPHFRGANFNNLLSRTCAKYGANENYIKRITGWKKIKL